MTKRMIVRVIVFVILAVFNFVLCIYNVSQLYR